MGKEINRITAKDVRELSDKSEFALKNIYKIIRELAEENCTSTEWCMYDMSKQALDNIKTYLKEDGFNIEHTNDVLIIKW